MAVLPLEGLLVIAVEQAVAAPFCTSRLADAGARVVKIERPTGDFARGYDAVANGQSSYFVWLNRGKESLVLDLAQPEQRKQLQELILQADILVQNLKPGAMARMGLAPVDMRALNPRLITCSISGYGDTGLMADRKAYDLLIQAESGLASITGGSEGPSRVGISLVDIATGATAHAALLEALIRRGITGEGVDIQVSMFDVMADWMTVPLLQAEGGKAPGRVGLAHPSIAPYSAFASGDGDLFLISVQSEREWVAFCRDFIGQPDLPQDPRFHTNVARVAHRSETDQVTAEAFAAKSSQQVVAALTQADIAFARVNDMTALSTHQHLRRITVDTPHGKVAYPAPAAMFSDGERAYRPVPPVGGNSDNSDDSGHA